MIPGCRQTVVKSTSSRLEVKIECDSPTSQRTYWALAEAIDTEHVEGAVMVRTEINRRAKDTRMKMKARWLGSDCGDVKPLPKD